MLIRCSRYICGELLPLTRKITDLLTVSKNLHKSLIPRYCRISNYDRQNVVQFNDNVYHVSQTRALELSRGAAAATTAHTWMVHRHTWAYAIHSICLRESLPRLRSRATSIDRPKHTQIQHNTAQLAMVTASTDIAYNLVSMQTGSNWARDRKSLDCEVISWIS